MKKYRKIYIGYLQILFHCDVYGKYEGKGKSEGEKGSDEKRDNSYGIDSGFIGFDGWSS